MRKVMLMTKALERAIPALYATEDVPTEEKKVVVKLFDPCGRFTFYAVEYDPKERLLFGWTKSALGSDCDELGYASLEELENVTNRVGLYLERDRYYSPNRYTLGQVMAGEMVAQ